MIVAVPALPAPIVQEPMPLAAIVAVPLVKQDTVWSAPAFGFALTVTLMVSAHPLAV